MGPTYISKYGNRKQVNQPQGFIHRIPTRPSIKLTCKDNDPRSRLVRLYARMGLHRYNLLQGKNLQLRTVHVYDKTTGSAASTYYMTLEAMDPATDLPLIFQTTVRERVYGEFVLNCSNAIHLEGTKSSDIFRGASKRSFVAPRSARKHCMTLDLERIRSVCRDLGIESNRSKRLNFVGAGSQRSDEPGGTKKRRPGNLPEWPPENPFENSKRCYVLNESELQDNDWIRLYLELAVATTNRTSIEKHDLSSLKIVQVAIDTATSTSTTEDVMDDDEERLKARNAIVYIRYTDSCEARVGMDADRVAIVRRAFDERRGGFDLVGQNMISPVGVDVDLGRGCLSSALDQIHLNM